MNKNPRINLSVDVALEAARRLAAANVPFDLSSDGKRGILSCKNEATLLAVVIQTRNSLEKAQ